jgi:hypothetical protein
MVYFSINENVPLSAPDLADKLAADGILIDAYGGRSVRLVAHYWIDDGMVDKMLHFLENTLERG